MMVVSSLGLGTSMVRTKSGLLKSISQLTLVLGCLKFGNFAQNNTFGTFWSFLEHCSTSIGLNQHETPTESNCANQIRELKQVYLRKQIEILVTEHCLGGQITLFDFWRYWILEVSPLLNHVSETEIADFDGFEAPDMKQNVQNVISGDRSSLQPNFIRF